MLENSENDELNVMEKKSFSNNQALNITINLIQKTVIFLTIYFVGYMHWSSAWVILFAIVSTIRHQFKNEYKKRWNIARAAALGYEENIVSNELQNLPSWVHFPDIERVEWLNIIIRQIWPHVNHYVRDLVPTLIEPKIKTFYKGFKFEKVILGRIPFRIDGIKVYNKGISRNKIVMDLDISYAGDCYITFSISGMKGGIENFQLCGRLRVIMRPLISTMPLVGGLQVYFLKDPEFDFDLVGVAQVLSIPGLRNILYKAVNETIASNVVFPNIFPIKLSDRIEASQLKIIEPEGVLRVHLVEAKHLMRKDINLLGKGKSDPYAIISVGPQQYKTQVIPNTINPKWDFWCEFILETNSELNIHVWDEDEGTKDETLGSTKLNIYDAVSANQTDLCLALEGVMHGMVRFRLNWFKFSTDYNDLKLILEETKLLKVSSMNTAILVVFIDSVKNLPQIKLSTQPDPFIVLQLGKQKYETEKIKHTTDPIYEEPFTFFICNPEIDVITIRVIDKQTNNEMGELIYHVNNLANKPNLEISNQQLALTKSGPQTTILCSFKLRIFKRKITNNITDNENKIENKLEEKELSLEERRESTKSLDCTGSIKIDKNVTEQLIEKMINSNDSTNSTSNILKRNSSTASSTGAKRLGRIKLTMRYSIQRQKLIVIIIEVTNLPFKYSANIPDPYVKLYLLPAKHKSSKRKTQIIRDNCNPVYDETFEYTLSELELNHVQLEITVASDKTKFGIGNRFLGQVIIDVSKYNLNQSITEWFDLEPKPEKD